MILKNRYQLVETITTFICKVRCYIDKLRKCIDNALCKWLTSLTCLINSNN